MLLRSAAPVRCARLQWAKTQLENLTPSASWRSPSSTVTSAATPWQKIASEPTYKLRSLFAALSARSSAATASRRWRMILPHVFRRQPFAGWSSPWMARLTSIALLNSVRQASSLVRLGTLESDRRKGCAKNLSKASFVNLASRLLRGHPPVLPLRLFRPVIELVFDR
jgi:hypothetical protein